MGLRNEPIQGRSITTLESIEEAARVVINRVGRDSFTTAMIAEESGRSIGTIYRYFPDRVSILDRVWPNRDGHLGGRFILDQTNGL